MKWIGIIVGVFVAVLVVAILVLAVLSSRRDAGRLQASIVIRQKPEAVWPWLYEPDKLKTWVSSLVEVRRDSSGPPANGGHDVWVMQDRNNKNAGMEINSVVEAAEQNRRLAVRLSARGFHGSAAYTLTDVGDGTTRVDLDSRYEFENRFVRLMTPLVLWQAGKKMATDFERLRASAEGRR